MEIELVLEARDTIGEAPTWVAAEGALYWIDVKAPRLRRLDPATGATRSWALPAEIGAFALEAGGAGAVVALRTGLFRLDLGSNALQFLAPPPFDPFLHRFNEGACDSAGRFWIGVMFDPLGQTGQSAVPAALHSYTRAEGLRPQPDQSDLHNGMAWSPDEQTFYLTHSNQRTVFAHDFDPPTGRLGPGRKLAVVEAGGIPDGAAVDAEGGYWCALHGGGRLQRRLPDGTLDREVALPVSQPTMCAFAGPELDVMYVTSALDGLTPEQLREQPHAGGLFRFRPGLRGMARPCHVA